MLGSGYHSPLCWQVSAKTYGIEVHINVTTSPGATGVASDTVELLWNSAFNGVRGALHPSTFCINIM